MDTAKLPPLDAPSFSPKHGHAIQQPLQDDEPAILPPLRYLGERTQRQHASDNSAEHERTRQEKLKLERYKVKRDMLRELLRAGVHSSQIPAFFADLDKNENLSSPSSEVSRSDATQKPMDALSQANQHRPSQQMSPNSSYQPGITSRMTSGSFTKRPSALASITGDGNLGQPSMQQPGVGLSYADLAAATTKPIFSAEMYSISPPTLQFKFYRPGPRQKGLRRKKGSISSRPNGIQKSHNRSHSRALSDATSPTSPNSTKINHNSTGHQKGRTGSAVGEGTVMSDMDDFSNEDEDYSGFKMG